MSPRSQPQLRADLQRELERLVWAPQTTTVGRLRTRLQRTLVSMGLAQLVANDSQCAITPLGREVERAGLLETARLPPSSQTCADRPPPQRVLSEPEQDLLDEVLESIERRLRSLRTDRNIAEFALLQIDQRIEEAERELALFIAKRGPLP
jgi:hypothetical protein